MKVNIALFVLSVVLLGGCEPDYDAPCRDQVTQIVNTFDGNQLACIPYGSADTVVFVSNSTDTLYLLTQSFTDGFTYLPTVVEGNPECPADVDAFQMMMGNLTDSVVGFGIQGLWKKENDSCWYTVAGKKYGMLIAQTGDPETVPYVDSLVNGQRVFYGVSTRYNVGGDSILLTKTEGVIYFVNGGKPFWLTSFNGK